MGDLRGLGVRVRKRSQALPDGARRKVGLLELDPEGHMTLCQDGCCLGCSLLIPTLYGPGQAPCQLFCRGRESHRNPTLATSPSPSGRLPLPFSIKSPGLQGRSTLGLGALGVGTSRGLGGETGRVSGPRAGGKLSLPRRKDVGWAGGLFEIWPPTEYTPRPLLSHLRLPVPLSPPSLAQPSPCQGLALAQSWALHTPEVPADSTQSCTSLFLGLWSPSGLLCCPVPPAALLHRGWATSLGLYKPSQPAKKLPGPHSRTSGSLQESCSQGGLLPGNSDVSPGSAISTEHSGLIPFQTTPLQLVLALSVQPAPFLTSHLRPAHVVQMQFLCFNILSHLPTHISRAPEHPAPGLPGLSKALKECLLQVQNTHVVNQPTNVCMKGKCLSPSADAAVWTSLPSH